MLEAERILSQLVSKECHSSSGERMRACRCLEVFKPLVEPARELESNKVQTICS
jgi:hypothetical protein